jgi:hypothetical protein
MACNIPLDPFATPVIVDNLGLLTEKFENDEEYINKAIPNPVYKKFKKFDDAMQFETSKATPSFQAIYNQWIKVREFKQFLKIKPDEQEYEIDNMFNDHIATPRHSGTLANLV